MKNNYKSLISSSITESINIKKMLLTDNNFLDNLIEIYLLIKDALNNKRKIIIFGNGGSASDALHINAEFIGRFISNRISLPSICLNSDSVTLTAISNDFGYESVFSRQIESLGNTNDIVIGISTSGNSKNVFNALLTAKNKKINTIALLGKDGGIIKNIADKSIIVQSNITARIQEIHILIGHLICEMVESNFNND